MKYVSKNLISVLLLIPVFMLNGETLVHSHNHGNNRIETSSFKAIPNVSLEVLKDSVEGWNIHLMTENFRFSPENINKEPIEGEGHAHLYIDGKKISRLYGAWFYLRNLSPGAHTLLVSLNGNNHAELVLNGKRIVDSRELIQ